MSECQEFFLHFFRLKKRGLFVKKKATLVFELHSIVFNTGIAFTTTWMVRWTAVSLNFKMFFFWRKKTHCICYWKKCSNSGSNGQKKPLEEWTLRTRFFFREKGESLRIQFLTFFASWLFTSLFDFLIKKLHQKRRASDKKHDKKGRKLLIFLLFD